MENVFEPMANFNQEKFEPLENFAGEFKKINPYNAIKSRIFAIQTSREYRDIRKKLYNDITKGFSESEKKSATSFFGGIDIKKALEIYNRKNKKKYILDLSLYSLNRIPNAIGFGFSSKMKFINNPFFKLNPFNLLFTPRPNTPSISQFVTIKNKEKIPFDYYKSGLVGFDNMSNFESDDSFEGNDYSNFDEMYFEGDDYSNFEEAYSNFGWFDNFRKKAGSFLNPVSRFKFLRDKIKEGYNRLRAGRNNDNKVLIGKRLGGIKQIFDYQKRLMSLKDEADRKRVIEERKNRGFVFAITLADKILKEKNLPIRNSNEILSIKKSSFEGMEYFDDMSSFDDFDTFEGDEYFDGDDYSNFGLVEWFKSKFGKKDISTQSTPTSISQEKKVFGMPRKTAIGVGVGLIAVGVTAFFLIKKKK